MLSRAASGQTEAVILLAAVLGISFAGALTDLLWGKIYNWLTLPAVLAGVAASGCMGGWTGLGSALLAVAVGLALYGWMFVVGAMGAGDVKFLMALGAWGGFHFVVETALLGVILGGLLAMGALIYRGKLLDFSKRMHRFLLSVFLKELEVEKPRIDHSSTLPFGIPIAIAAGWVALGHPLEAMGVYLWNG